MDSLNELNDDDHVTQRALEWSSSLGVSDGLYIRAHRDPIEYKHCEGGRLEISHDSLNDLSSRLDLERKTLSPSATFSDGEHAHTDTMFHGMSSAPLSGIDFRTRFEHDRDSILHCEPFRRLAGKTQVHLERSDHQRTRLTHALEVAQIASAIARSLRLNAVLAEAIALGHDCGHGPGGHASEDALDPYLDGGFHHAIFGAEVTLRPLRLSHEVIDGVRNHSWSLDTPLTPEAEVVSFSDRIAYVCHDLEDALSCSMVSRRDYPQEIASFLNLSRGEQIGRFIRGVVQGTFESGTVAILHEYGEILSAMRKFNTEFIYRSPRSMKQNALVIEMLSELVEFFIGHSQVMPQYFQRNDEGDARVREGVVEYVAGMTDDYAYRMHAQYVKNDPITSHEVLYMI